MIQCEQRVSIKILKEKVKKISKLLEKKWGAFTIRNFCGFTK